MRGLSEIEVNDTFLGFMVPIYYIVDVNMLNLYESFEANTENFGSNKGHVFDGMSLS